MNKLNRILSLIICFAMVVISVPGISLISADDSFATSFVLEDNTEYASFADATNWSMPASELVEAGVDADGNITYTHKKEVMYIDGKQNLTNAEKLAYKLPESTIFEDPDNRTKITTDNYTGNVVVTVVTDLVLNDDAPNNFKTEGDAASGKIAASWSNLAVGDGTTNAIGAKLYPTYVTIVNSSGSKVGTQNQFSAAANRTIVYTINTTADKVSGASGGRIAETDLTSKVKYISEINVSGLQRLGADSKVTVDSLKVEVTPDFTDAEIKMLTETLPPKLVDDVNNVTGNITLPSASNITWESSNPAVISTTGKVSKIVGATQEVTLTATAVVDGVTYKKSYSMTVAEGEEVLYANFYVDGESIETVELKKGEKLSTISAPEKEGMDFVGWYEENATESFDFNTAITKNVNLYAKYKLKTHKVYFRIDTFVQEDLTIEVEHGGVVGNVPALPDKAGKTPIGWVVEGSTDELLSNDKVVEADIYVDALYGESGATAFTVTFKNGEETVATTTAWPGYTFEFPENPVKENYTFVYWERNGEEFKETDVMLGKDIILNAVFTPNPVEVKFYSDATKLYYTGTGYYDTAYGNLPAAPAIEGKAFKYWTLENGEKFTTETVITGPVSVYANWDEPKVIVNEDITKYTSLTDGLIKFAAPDTGYTSASFDNGLKLTLSDWEPLTEKGAANGGNVYGLGTYFRAMIDSDDDARTKTYMNNLVGEYEIEFIFDMNCIHVKEYEGVTLNESYMQFNMGAEKEDGSYISAPFTARVKNFLPDGGQNISVHGYDANKNAKSESLIYVKEKLEHSYTVHFNTYTQVATAWAEGNANSPKGASLVWNAQTDFINSIRLYPMLRMGVGSYFKIKNIKITEFNTDTEADGYKATKGAIDSLPEKLAENPFEVTENIELPQVDGVVWTTSDESVIDINGNVNRWYDDLDVVLTATAVSEDGYKYSKEYELTVKAFEFEKENVEISADTSNWSFVNRADQQEAKYSFDGNDVKVEKVTVAENPASPKENKTYFAYYDLYNEVASDTYSATSTNVYEGVYDLEIDIENAVTSDVPMNMAIGYKNGDYFFTTATLKVASNMINLSYPDSGETSATSIIYAANTKNAKLKLRIDADNNKLSAWIDGKLAFRNISYVSPFPAASGIDMFSTLRIGVDSNNNAGDYIVVKDVSMKKINAQEISSVASALKAAENVTVSMLTNSPENVSGNLKALPSTSGSYTINWATDCEQIDLKTGEVFFDETATDAIVTAYISDNSLEYPVVVRKDFKLHIRERANDAEYGEFLINSLGAITNQDYDNIKYDLNLPVNNDIIWTSSDSVIGADGKLDMNADVYKTKEVKLIASAYGSSREYKLKVAPRTAQNAIYTGNLPATIAYGSYQNLKLSANAYTEFTLTGTDAEGKVNIVDENGNVIVSTVVETGGFYFDYKGSEYVSHSLANGEVKKIKIFTMPEDDKLAIWVDGKITDDYVDFRNATSHMARVEKTNDALDVADVKVSIDNYGKLVLNIENLDYYKNVGNGILSSDIVLPTASITNADVKWVSGNKDILTNDGKVTMQNALTYTTLDFTISDKTNGNVSINKTFDIIVECDNSKNIANGAYLTVSKLENQTYPKTNVNDNNYETAYRITSASTKSSDIVFEFTSEKLINTMLLAEDAGNIRNVRLYASKDNNEWTEVYAGDMSKVANRTVVFDATPARYMKLTIESSNASVVDINEIKFYLFASAEDIAQLDMSAIKVPATASKDIELITLGANGTVIKWTSSDENVISTTGKVTRGDKACNVTLTATAEGTGVTRTFDVYVPAGGSSSGPQIVGGGSGGSGGGGGGTAGGANANVSVGNDVKEPVYTEEVKKEEPSTSTVYSDVKTTDWYAEAVVTLTEKGIISGDGTGKFNPKDKVTREQFLKMIIEAASIETDNAENTFEDVKPDSWYVNYVLTAKKLGIVNGMSEMEFGIGMPISRQDMAVFIERLINLKKYEVTKNEVEDFKDASNVSDYAKDAVANMKSIGLIQGYENMYNPKDNLTRAEAATVIASLLKLIEK